MESQLMDPLEPILVQQQAIQGAETTKGVLVEAPQPVAMQEEMAEVQEVHKHVVLQEFQMVVLQRDSLGGSDTLLLEVCSCYIH